MYIKEGKGKLALFLHCKQCFTYPSPFHFLFSSSSTILLFSFLNFFIPIFPSSSSSFLLFSLHHRHIPIVFPPPPSPPHFYCFHSSCCFPTKQAKKANLRPKSPNIREPELGQSQQQEIGLAHSFVTSQ